MEVVGEGPEAESRKSMKHVWTRIQERMESRREGMKRIQRIEPTSSGQNSKKTHVQAHRTPKTPDQERKDGPPTVGWNFKTSVLRF
jgi:hypothetical protein